MRYCSRLSHFFFHTFLFLSYLRLYDSEGLSTHGHDASKDGNGNSFEHSEDKNKELSTLCAETIAGRLLKEVAGTDTLLPEIDYILASV